MDNKKKELTEEEKQRRNAYLIGFLIAFVVSIPIAVGSFFMIKDGLRLDYETEKWRIWTDTFTLPGVLYILVFCLVKVSDWGAFDAITYSVRLLFNTIFFPTTKNSKLPKTYSEYRELKRGKKRISATFLLYIGLLYMALMLVFLILWYANR
ncbi:MAG: DUF3899 domain-containing protein [Bacilli bacterium]|nr:DUF3899 domain-containing protein [Bacilli bacterium]